MDPLMKLTELEKAFPIFGMVVSAILTVYSADVAYDIHASGEIPAKNIENTIIGPLDPFAMTFNTNVGLNANVDGVNYSNLQIATVITRNVGLSPILPTDIYQEIGLRVDKPYKMVSVYSPDIGPRSIQFSWHRVSDTLYQATPTLLNPGDQVQSVALMTLDIADKTNGQKYSLNLVMTGRIVNMASFSEPSQNISLGKIAFLWISLYNWQIFFFIGLFMFYEFLYLFLLNRAGLFRNNIYQTSGLFVGVSLISAAASEAISTYSFGFFKGIFVDYTVSNWINAPWIIINLASIVYLYSRRPVAVSGVP